MTDGAFRSAVTKQYQWDFPNALDLGDATWKLFGVPTTESTFGVVIGPDGKVLEARGLQWFYRDGDKKGKTVVQAAVEDAMAKHAADGAVPAKAKPVSDLIRQGELGKALAAARKLPDKPADVAAWRDQTVTKLEERKTARLERLRSLAASDERKFDALQEAECLMRAFGSEKDVADEAKPLIQKLRSDAAVKKELAARDLYLRAAEALAGGKQQRAAAVAVIEKLRKDCADTRFGKLADALGAD